MNAIEYRKILEELVANGELVPELVDVLLREKFPLEAATGFTTNVTPAPTSVETLVEQPSVPFVPEADMASAASPKLEAIANAPSDVVSPEYIAQAQAEIDNRARIQGLSFLETLSDPDALSRLGRTAMASVPRTATAVTYMLPALGATALAKGSEAISSLPGIETLPAEPAIRQGLNEYAEQSMNTGMTMMEDYNQLLGVSDPITPYESLVEQVPDLFAPASYVGKLGLVSADFMVDQAFRELTDENGAEYSTVFDEAGLPETPQMNMLTALPLAIASTAAVSLGVSAVGRLAMERAVTIPTARDVIEIDPHAPEGLQTLTTSNDMMMAHHVDWQSSLTGLLNRAGVPDPEDLATRLTLDVGSAASARVREGVRTGQFAANGRTYSVPTSVETLYNAYTRLPVAEKDAVGLYINLRDMLNDARIALAKSTAQDIPPEQAAAMAEMAQRAQRTVAQHSATLAQLERRFPSVRTFSTQYNAATHGVRDFLEGSLLSSNERQWLDLNRPDYVPYYRGNIDTTAPFLTRLRQGFTSQDAGISTRDAFLLERDSVGDYDPRIRPDPFTMLFEYTNKALHEALANDTKLAIVDSLRNSTHGSRTIQAVAAGSDISRNASRLVEAYRAGAPEQYLAEQFTADMLRLDPHLAQHPFFFVPKRLSEKYMVGPFSKFFALTSLVRDTIGGPVVRPEGLNVGGPLSVAAAIPRQLGAKAMEEVARSLEASLLSNTYTIPLSIWPEQSRRAMAGMLSRTYMNTYYHMAQTAGGLDASILRNNVNVAKTALDEVARTIDIVSDTSPLSRTLVRHGVKPVQAGLRFWSDMYSAVLDAPRFAAFTRTVKDGTSAQEAAMLARNLVGDTSRSGRIYNADGRLIRGDTVDQGIAAAFEPQVARGASYVHEGAPFVTPTIQGNRRLLASMRDDPIGTSMRAWMGVGLPALAALGWNEMLGEEYNDYAMNTRAASDVVMSVYIGLPGKPPEEGLELSVPHELMLMNAPYSRALYGFLRGEDRHAMSAAMQEVTKAIFENSSMISSPTTINLAFEAAGYNAPDNLLLQGAYEGRENINGVLPTNLELMAKELFGNLATTSLQLMSVAEKDWDSENVTWNDYWDELMFNTVETAPIVRNLDGTKIAYSTFSIPAQIDRRRETAIEELWPYYKEFVDPKYDTTNGFSRDRDRATYTGDEGLISEPDLPIINIGSPQLQQPLNPLFGLFSTKLMNEVKRNGIGISGIDDRLEAYNAQVNKLRAYNSGDRQALQDWQQTLTAITTGKAGVTAGSAEHEIAQILDTYGLDLSRYEDRVKLINYIQNQRASLLQVKLEAVSSVEHEITVALQNMGLLQADQRFTIETGMRVDDEAPYGITAEMLQTGLGSTLSQSLITGSPATQ